MPPLERTHPDNSAILFKKTLCLMRHRSQVGKPGKSKRIPVGAIALKAARYLFTAQQKNRKCFFRAVDYFF